MPDKDAAEGVVKVDMRNSAPGADLSGAEEASLKVASLPWYARVSQHTRDSFGVSEHTSAYLV